MTVYTSNYSISTTGNADIHDITARVKEAVEQSGLLNGIVTVFCPSSTSGVTTIENEPGVLNDLRRLFDEIANPDRPYQHDAAWHDGNGHSHVRAALLKPSLTVPFAGGRLTLGTWQSIVYIDFDNRPRQREIVLQVMGEL
jgi:secondary thiamine-phosphate synthase enzyme